MENRTAVIVFTLLRNAVEGKKKKTIGRKGKSSAISNKGLIA